MAVLLAGLPTDVTGVTVNRLCGSSLEAAIQAARAVETGDASLVVAGGVESMSRAPWVVSKPARGFPTGHDTLHSTTLGWRMVNPRMPERWTISLGASAEKLATTYRVTREQQDEFALRSHRLAAQAYCDGALDEVVPVPGVELLQHEGIRSDTSVEKVARLEPAFVDGGTVTAGNSSPLNDGAAALLVADERSAGRIGCEPLARIVARAAHGVDPDIFGIAPVEAANAALRRAATRWDDIEVVGSTRPSRRSRSRACARGPS